MALIMSGTASAASWQMISTQAKLSPDSAADAWGLGANTSGQTSAVHLSGTAQAAFPLPTTVREAAISADGPGDAWVAGSRGVTGGGYGRRQPVLIHYNGSSWTTFSLADDGKSEQLSSVAVLSPADAWAAGSNALLHWDGTQWSRTTAPAPQGTTGSVNISALSRSGTDLWALGSATVGGVYSSFAARWDGIRWNLTPLLPATPAGHWRSLGNISASSPSSAWVAVTDYDQNYDSSALALRWNGSSWQAITMPAHGVEQTLSGIAAGSGEAWAVGEFANSSSDNAPRAALYRWNGSAWSAVSFPVTTAYSYVSSVMYVPGSAVVWASGFDSSGWFAAHN